MDSKGVKVLYKEEHVPSRILSLFYCVCECLLLPD